MRIGIYTDVHCCYTSSIMPLHNSESKYTTRLQMIVDTFSWMYDVFDNNSVDLIINCGDLFDSHNIRAEEICAMSDALSFGGQIPEFHILGNHEIVDNNRTFYANGLLSRCDHIQLVDQPLKLSNGISLLPYMPWQQATEVLPLLSNKYLFSHIDIKGSNVTPTHALTDGVDPTKLSDLFTIVVNGHLHSPQSWGNKIFNIGSTTSLSFSDNSDYNPRISILDTNTNTFEFFDNPYAIRFVKLAVQDMSDLSTQLSKPYSMILRIQCSSALKPEVDQLLADSGNVIASRIQLTDAHINTSSADKANTDQLNAESSVMQQFHDFLDGYSELKYPKEDYFAVLRELEAKS